MSGQQSQSPSSRKYSRLCSDFTLTLHGPPSSDEGLTIISIFLFTLSTVICCGFSLVSNVLTVSCFWQKCLLNALNVNVNYRVRARAVNVTTFFSKPKQKKKTTKKRLLSNSIIIIKTCPFSDCYLTPNWLSWQNSPILFIIREHPK